MLRNDCRYFGGDRPCKYHKEDGFKCDDCQYYAPRDFRILIVKLDSIGDVLRTTSILPGLKTKYPDSYITWITNKESKELFRANQYVDEVLEPGDGAVRLQVEYYDHVINLDPSAKSAALASLSRADKKFGFGLEQKGNVFTFNDEANTWFEMGAFDDVKKANKNTYQRIIHEICNLPFTDDSRIVLNLLPEEQSLAVEFMRDNNIKPAETVIGLNTGAGPRWKQKKWTFQGFVELIEMIDAKLHSRILLYGGPHEKERNKRLQELFAGKVIDTGHDNTLREFFALLSLCDVAVTGDTIALHALLGLGKKVVALFGPTSAQEIEMYDRGSKIVADLDCTCCYRHDCDREPNCMQSIEPVVVYKEIKKLLS